MTILLLNYTHPLTDAQRAQVAALAGDQLEIRDIGVQIDRARPLAEAAVELAEAAGLAPADWQTRSLLVNPPGLAPLALALIAELHGRSGHFPAILNIRPLAEATPPRYEVAETVNLQALRDAARGRR
ncbi:MAG: CRISPR-associated protein Csx15 [Roseiflexaceae bacterium]